MQHCWVLGLLKIEKQKPKKNNNKLAVECSMTMCRLNGNKSCKLQLYGASSFPPNVNTSDHLTHCKALAQPTCEKRANTELLF